MTVTRDMLETLHRNIDQEINIFNYDSVVKNTIYDFLKLMRSFTPELREEKMKAVSNILYKHLYEIYPTSLRDKNNWDNYFDRTYTSIKTTILPIEKEENNTKNKEMSLT